MVAAGDVTVEYGDPAQVQVAVTGGGGTATGTVRLLDGATQVGHGHGSAPAARPPSRSRRGAPGGQQDAHGRLLR